ncbi:MAG TPA: hypothetical protein VEP46_17555, partial [Vicinamibacterales bacterium]|nr:hypothetical protein [Vicinamibacterales bacterium]
LELLVSEEKLFTGRPDELRPAVHTPKGLVLELHRSPPLLVVGPRLAAALLLGFASKLLAITLSRQRLLGAAFVTRLQVEGVLLDVLDDVFLLHLPLEPSESALDGLALLNLDFSHPLIHPLWWARTAFVAVYGNRGLPVTAFENGRTCYAITGRRGF